MTSADSRQPDIEAGVQAALQRAMTRRAAGDLAGSLAALDEALNLDPYHFVALLSKGALTEKISGERNTLHDLQRGDSLGAVFERYLGGAA